jgi:hypothetical protein
MTVNHVDQIWVELNTIAEDRWLLDDRTCAAIERARNADRTWDEIAKTLKLSSATAAQRLYQEIVNRAVGIEGAS